MNQRPVNVPSVLYNAPGLARAIHSYVYMVYSVCREFTRHMVMNIYGVGQLPSYCDFPTYNPG
jgi:hypothetical protein